MVRVARNVDDESLYYCQAHAPKDIPNAESGTCGAEGYRKWRVESEPCMRQCALLNGDNYVQV